MAIISDKHKFLFIMNPRTGCTAISLVLRDKLGGRYVPKEDIVGPDGKVLVQKKHTTLDELRQHKLVMPEILDTYFKFTTVRNPFDSLVSLWTKKRYAYGVQAKNNPDSILNKLPGYTQDMEFIQTHAFAEWVMEYFPNKKSPTVNAKHVKGTDGFLRFEFLQEDFEKILKEIGIEGKYEIPVANKTDGRINNYRGYYTAEARAVIEEKFKDELKLYGYSF